MSNGVDKIQNTLLDEPRFNIAYQNAENKINYFNLEQDPHQKN